MLLSELTAAEWEANAHRWIPDASDRAYVASLMKPCLVPGKVAHWIAPPRKGIGGQAVEFEYVRPA
jgi:benzoyl-CoA 2,3-dioxygenase component B